MVEGSEGVQQETTNLCVKFNSTRDGQENGGNNSRL